MVKIIFRVNWTETARLLFKSGYIFAIPSLISYVLCYSKCSKCRNQLLETISKSLQFLRLSVQNVFSAKQTQCACPGRDHAPLN